MTSTEGDAVNYLLSRETGIGVFRSIAELDAKVDALISEWESVKGITVNHYRVRQAFIGCLMTVNEWLSPTEPDPAA